MAYTSGQDVNVGDPTKEDEHDILATNTDFLQTAADAEHDFDVTTGDGSHNPGLFWRNAVVHPTDESAGYTTIQAADDALDGSAGYTLLVKGRSTYAETVTVSTDYNYIRIGPKTIITSLVLSGTGNHVLIEPGFQCTGALTLSGPDNTVEVRGAADLDGAVSLSGARSKLIVGATSNLASTLTLSGDDTYYEQGANTQVVGAITQSGFNTVVELGTSANIDGALSISAAGSVHRAGASSNYASTIDTTAAADNGVRIILGPSCSVTGAITLAGDQNALRVGAKSNLDGIVTMSGSGDSLICDNGVDLDGIVCSGGSPFIDGGGWQTRVNGTNANHALEMQSGAANGTVINIALSTTNGGGQPYNGLEALSDNCHYHAIFFQNADNSNAHVGGSFCEFVGCWFTGADGHALNVDSGVGSGGNNVVCVANRFGNTTGSNDYNTQGDRGLVVANHFLDSGTNLNITANAEDHIVAGNNHNGTFTDSSGTSTVANNENH